MFKIGDIVKYRNKAYLTDIGIEAKRDGYLGIIVDIEEQSGRLFPTGKKYWVRTFINGTGRTSVPDRTKVNKGPGEFEFDFYTGEPGIILFNADVQLEIF